VADRYDGRWPLEQYGRAARALGGFNGAYLGGEPWPAFAWLDRTTREPRGVLAAYGWIEALVLDPQTWRHPLLRECYSERLVARLQALWRGREPLLDALERLPQTVCHQDAWRANMMAVEGGDDKLVVIDWAYVGRGALGTDLGDLVAAGLWGGEHTPAEMHAVAFDAYLDGLRAAGCPASRDQVRFGFATYSALKYGGLLLWLRDLDDPERRAFWERLNGQPMKEIVAQGVAALEYLVDLYDEAVGLLEVI
jgi:hypothetical protein